VNLAINKKNFSTFVKIINMPYHKDKDKKEKKAAVGAALLALSAAKSAYGAVQAARARKAERDFEEDRLKFKVTDATRKLAEEPFSQRLIEESQARAQADRASAIGALSRDPRNLLAGVAGLERQRSRDELSILGAQEAARTKAMQNLAGEQKLEKLQDIKIAEAEIKGIQAEKDAAVKNIFSGLEDAASGVGAGGVGDIRKLFGATDVKPVDANTIQSILSIRRPFTGMQSSTPNVPLFNLQGLQGIRLNQPSTRFGPISEEGGKIDDDGGVTPGEFDHDTNPIDIVQDGEKIGEATGGELILPPDDVEAIRVALKKDDTESAINLMKKLVAKYDKNTIGKDEDIEQMKEQKEEEQKNFLSNLSARMGAFLNRR
tara:strand:+ start:6258 stop:7382 length:1125 start_codon:yes stop_codon:yes gene_type:complete